MTKLMFVRIVGWIQLALSALLVLATISAFLTYRSSVGEMSGSLAAAILSVSDVVTKVANTVEVRQELIGDTRELLISYGTLVTNAIASAETQATLLPEYSKSVRAASSRAAETGETFIRMSNSMLMKPFVNKAESLKAFGGDLKQVGASLSAMADSINSDAIRLNTAFIASSQKTLKLINSATKATEKLKSQDLPPAIASLKATADNLRKASAQAHDVAGLAEIILGAGMLLAVLFAFNGVGVLLIAGTLDKRATMPLIEAN